MTGVKLCEVGCSEPAEIQVSWVTSLGPQSAAMCGGHSSEFWSKIGSTPTGETVTLREIIADQEVQS